MKYDYKIMVAYDSKRGIGKNNTIPWNIPEDLKRLKEYTLNQTIVMATKTFDSIIKDFGKPLPKRLNVVVSRSIEKIDYENCDLLRTTEEVLEKYPKAWIFGGSYLYNEFMPYVNQIYATEIEKDYECQVFFPKVNMEEWKITEEEQKDGYKFVTYSRI
ncbi:MAG: dihydrofolate reductase [Candidatus Sericytochromatia bacterium]|nr:dihydrofolate reductase [Candidatus Sericytochromatia bacterium]